MGHGDGIGAYAYVGYAGFEMKVSNGCDSHPLGDNIWISPGVRLGLRQRSAGGPKRP